MNPGNAEGNFTAARPSAPGTHARTAGLEVWGCGPLSPYSMRSPVDTVVILKDAHLPLSQVIRRRKCVCWGILCAGTQDIYGRDRAQDIGEGQGEQSSWEETCNKPSEKLGL